MPSKLELAKVGAASLNAPPSLTTDPDPETNPNPTLAKLGAASTLVGYLDHEAKQCRLNP